MEDLAALVTPPAEPVGAPFDWPTIEAAIGLSLPTDYMAFCDLYGHGSFFAGWSFTVAVPGAPSGFMDLPEHQLDFALEDTSWSPHPTPGGLLLLASTENRETFWWRTDTWTVLYEDMSAFEEMDATATEAILLTLRGDAPANWGLSVEDDGSDDGVDRTVHFYPSGQDPPEDEDDEDWGEQDLDGEEPGGGSRLLEAGCVDGVWRLTVDLGGDLQADRQSIVDEFMAAVPWWAGHAIERAGTDQTADWLELKSARWTPIVELAVNRWVRARES